jgi:hypothetical protein
MVCCDLNRIITPLNPPLERGETRKSGSLPFIRGGLGRGKKIFGTSIMTFKTFSERLFEKLWAVESNYYPP